MAYETNDDPDYGSAAHESGHCTAILHHYGEGQIAKVNLHGCELKWRPPPGRASLIVAAAGRAAESVAHAGPCPPSGGDLDAYREDATACPATEYITWNEAITRASYIIIKRRKFFDALARALLEHGEVEGAVVDMLWRQYEEKPARREVGLRWRTTGLQRVER
jgi:hypothetical protein